jgi:hypothetical protein
MDTIEIEAQLIEVLGRADEWLPTDQLAGLRELTRSGEPRIVLEILCVELFAFDAAVPVDVWERLRRLSRELGIQDDYGGWLAPRVKAEHGPPAFPVPRSRSAGR